MGGLIATKGTRRLIKKLNTVFGRAKITATKASIAADPGLSALFSTPSGTAPIIEKICFQNATGRGLFLPPQDDTHHKNLLKRWDYYLGNELSNSNHELLRGFIWAVLNGPNGLQGANSENVNGDTYTAIQFDCVEGTTQTILQSDEYKLKNSDTDDTGLSQATAYSKIVLITAPTAAPIPIDPQF